MKVKEYEWGREGDVANESENGKGVGTRADHEHSEDEGKEKESRNNFWADLASLTLYVKRWVASMKFAKGTISFSLPSNEARVKLSPNFCFRIHLSCT